MFSGHLLVRAVIILCFLAFLLEIYGQENENMRHITDKNNPTIARSGYYSIGEWNDVPILHCAYKSGAASNVPNKFDISVWQDGRIAWRDCTKPGSYFFHTQIPRQKVEEVVEKLEKDWELLRKNERLNNTIPLTNERTLYLGSIFSQKMFRTETWSHNILNMYKSNREAFIEKFSSDDCDQALNALNVLGERNRNTILGNYRLLFNQYIDKNEFDYRLPYSSEEVCNYARLFYNDAEFFLRFEEMIKALIPDNSILVSTNLESKHVSISIMSQLENGKKAYTYCAVVQPISSDLKPPDSDTDSGEIMAVEQVEE